MPKSAVRAEAKVSLPRLTSPRYRGNSARRTIAPIQDNAWPAPSVRMLCTTLAYVDKTQFLQKSCVRAPQATETERLAKRP
jgi:hypothetical protein